MSYWFWKFYIPYGYVFVYMTIFKCMYFKEPTHSLKTKSSIFSFNRIKNVKIVKKMYISYASITLSKKTDIKHSSKEKTLH